MQAKSLENHQRLGSDQAADAVLVVSKRLEVRGGTRRAMDLAVTGVSCLVVKESIVG